MKTASELLGRFYKLRSQYGERDSRYLANWYAYKGEYDRIFENYTADALAMSRKRSEKTIQKWNLVRPIVDTYRLLINQMPTIEVPAPVFGEELAAMKADKQEKALYALYDMGHMQRKHGEASFNLALNTASVWQAVWDDEMDIPVPVVRSPGETYPVMKRGGDEVAFCFFRWEEDAEALAEKYPQIKSLLKRGRDGEFASGNVEVVEYVDEEDRVFIIGGEIKAFITSEVPTAHKLKQCPVFIVPGLCIPGELFPPGPVDQLVVMNDHLNRFQTKLGDAIEETLFGWHDIEGEGANDVVLNTGPGAVNRLEGANLRHNYTQPQPPPSQAFGHVDQVQRYMRNLANWPEVASGEMSGSIITGKAVTRLQGIMAAQASEYQENMRDSLGRVNSILMKMMEVYRPDKQFDLYATEGMSISGAPGRKRNFGVSIIPQDDFQGYYRNTVHYSPFGSDMSGGIETGMRLVDAKIWSRSHLRNLLPGTSDAEGEAKEIEEEDRRRMETEVDLQTDAQIRIMEAQTKQQQQLQAAAPGVGGTGAPVAPAEQSQNAPPGGLPPQTPPSPAGSVIGGNTTLMPGGQPQLMGLGEPMTGSEGFPLPYTGLKPFGPAMAELAGTGVHGQGATEAALGGAQPGPNAITLQEVQDVFSSIQKLKGAVFVFGDVVDTGYTDGSVEVGLTNPGDKATIVNAVKGTKLYGKLIFSSTIPTSGTVQVAGPQAA
jgi:hypothetical protein